MPEEYLSGSVNKRLVMSLRDLSHTMRSLYEGRGSQARVLIVLRGTGAVTQQELTERLGIRPGSASEVIAKLEAAGLVSRTPDESDRRTLRVSLTDEGERRAREAEENRERRHVEMFSCLTDEEKTTLLSLLEKLCRDWAERYPESGHVHHGHCRGREE